MNAAAAIVFIGILVFLAHLFSAIFSRTRIPDALELIVIGLILGPVLGIVTPQTFGAVGPIFTSITLVVILFESGIGLNIESLRKAMRGTLMVTTLNFVVTMLAVGLIASELTELDPLRALMLGAIVGGTSSAVVIPLVRQIKIGREAKSILVLESAISDVFTITVALAFLEAIKLGQIRFGLLLGHLLATFVLAVIFGTLGAFAWSVLLNKVRTLHNSIFTTPAFVFIIYGIVELLGYSGAVAALAFGVTLGNIELFRLPILKKYIPHDPISLNDTEKIFFSEIVFLIKTFFFVYIGISIQLINIWPVSLGLLLTLIVFILRIPVVRFSVNRTISISDASLMAVMVPKGLAAAVLASIPLQQGIIGGELIQNVTYAVVLFSIVLTAVLIFLLGKTKLSKFYEKMFQGFSSSTEEIPEKLTFE